MNDKTLVIDHEDKIRLIDRQIAGLYHQVSSMVPMHNANIILSAAGVLSLFLMLGGFICFVLFGHDKFTSMMAILITLVLIGTGLHFFFKTMKKRVKM